MVAGHMRSRALNARHTSQPAESLAGIELGACHRHGVLVMAAEQLAPLPELTPIFRPSQPLIAKDVPQPAILPGRRVGF